MLVEAVQFSVIQSSWQLLQTAFPGVPVALEHQLEVWIIYQRVLLSLMKWNTIWDDMIRYDQSNWEYLDLLKFSPSLSCFWFQGVQVWISIFLWVNSRSNHCFFASADWNAKFLREWKKKSRCIKNYLALITWYCFDDRWHLLWNWIWKEKVLICVDITVNYFILSCIRIRWFLLIKAATCSHCLCLNPCLNLNNVRILHTKETVIPLYISSSFLQKKFQMIVSLNNKTRNN